MFRHVCFKVAHELFKTVDVNVLNPPIIGEIAIETRVVVELVDQPCNGVKFNVNH